MIIVVKVEHKNFCFQIYICPGDSGGPTIWEDKWDKKFPNRAYLIGIISGTSAYKKKNGKTICGKAENNFFVSFSTTVPGNVLHWIKNFEYDEIQQCLRSNVPALWMDSTSGSDEIIHSFIDSSSESISDSRSWSDSSSDTILDDSSGSDDGSGSGLGSDDDSEFDDSDMSFEGEVDEVLKDLIDSL